jgi:hypothetical protein
LVKIIIGQLKPVTKENRGEVFSGQSDTLFLNTERKQQIAHRKETSMSTITDEYMRQMLVATRNYSLVILKAGPNKHMEGAEEIIWEHGRRNFELRATGVLPIVCPVNDGSDVSGIGILNTSVEEARQIMDIDPGVQAGIFVYEVHPCRGFPGSSLP